MGFHMLFKNFADDPTAFDTNLPHTSASHNQLADILQIVIAVLAALAILFIVIAGLRFVTAQGNPQEVSKARNTIVYAIVGLLIAIIAEAIVALVLKNL
jgi:FtsH-binding integral membrane protein